MSLDRISTLLDDLNAEVEDQPNHADLRAALAGFRSMLISVEAPDVVGNRTLTRSQQRAYNRIMRWLGTDSRYFVLKGGPGTGKSWLLSYIDEIATGWTFAWSAPTNKAAGVLSGMIGERVSTTYSLLGLRMSEDEDELVMEYGRSDPYFRRQTVLVVDECSMVNMQLVDFIDTLAIRLDLKVLYVGDPYQLPPVGERTSKSWSMVESRQHQATLRQTVRFDSQLLALSRRIRRCIRDSDWRNPIDDDNDGRKGVMVMLNRQRFLADIAQLRSPEEFDNAKVIAWRNRTVDSYNEQIRYNLGFRNRFEPGERVLMAEPVFIGDQMTAAIDDEFVVRSVRSGKVRTARGYIEVEHLEVAAPDLELVLAVPLDYAQMAALLADLSTEARNAPKNLRRSAWQLFWRTHRTFHACRYAYAMTSHRVQGSTLHTTYLDQRDVMANQNREECFRSLNVAATRATTWLKTF